MDSVKKINSDTPLEKLPGYNGLGNRLKTRLKKMKPDMSFSDVIQITTNDLFEIKGLGRLCVMEFDRWRESLEVHIESLISDPLLIAADRVIKFAQKNLNPESVSNGVFLELDKEVRKRKLDIIKGTGHVDLEERVKNLEEIITNLNKK